jgi:fructokinase
MAKHDNKRAMIFGEVLFDCFPDGSEVLGGAPFNVAWHLQAFGQQPRLISRVGNDPLGRVILKAMQNWGMTCSTLQTDSTHPTGTVQVRFKDHEPSFEITAERAYDFIDADSLPTDTRCSVLYHGSLALRHGVSRAALVKLKQHLAAPIFVDVNLRPPWWEREYVLSLLQGADWVKLNADELSALTLSDGDFASQAEALQTAHRLKRLFVTRGREGAYVRTSEGTSYEIQPARNLKLVDTVGAGDAFASVLLLGLIKEWPLEMIMERAQAFASALVGVRGATVSDRSFYTPFIETWGLP